ncbi:MAG: serine/threonine protein kinase [Caldilineaceae bacterium]|nr:serine/threonine protein kinase [Caldilineaceae bacterium]
MNPSNPDASLPPGSQIGGYLIESVLGEGAAATVYRAHRAESEPTSESESAAAPVALKVLKAEGHAQPHVLASFQFEARVLSRLDHPGILRVYEMGYDGGQIYTAMELVDGISLDIFLLAKQKLAQRLAIEYGRQAADALGYLHEHGYVHRDIKPANLMLTREGRVVLYDFGTVIRINDGAAYEMGLYGTPSFLAPEQIEPGRKIDGRSDLYALGMVLYLMAVGRKPFYGTRDDVLDAHVNDPPPPPSEFGRISPALEAVILKAIAKRPEDRFQSGAEFAQALVDIELPAAPEKPSLGQRLFGWLRSDR